MKAVACQSLLHLAGDGHDAIERAPEEQVVQPSLRPRPKVRRAHLRLRQSMKRADKRFHSKRLPKNEREKVLLIAMRVNNVDRLIFQTFMTLHRQHGK